MRFMLDSKVWMGVADHRAAPGAIQCGAALCAAVQTLTGGVPTMAHDLSARVPRGNNQAP